MSNRPFRFKKFDVHHDKCAMKVGTDGVLLGALSGEKPHYSKILEIGLGTGLVSLMLAQRFEKAYIQGVEIDFDAFEQANQNARSSPWFDRLSLEHEDFNEFFQNYEERFDLIVSNPPYFASHLKSPNAKRNLALHTDSLSFEALLKGVNQLLSEKGEFWVILPEYETSILTDMAVDMGFFLRISIEIKDSMGKPILRKISSFTKNRNEILNKSLSIKELNGEYSNDYKNLLKDFLIIF